jgi:hypothetical protein
MDELEKKHLHNRKGRFSFSQNMNLKRAPTRPCNKKYGEGIMIVVGVKSGEMRNGIG